MSSTQTTTERYLLIDSLRGLAILLMIAYHFSFDLNMFGVLHQAFNQQIFWLTARAIIVTLFLLMVGISLVLANQKNHHHYWKRIAKLAACSLLVTLGSAILFPQSYIFFGVLHLILFASLIGRVLLTFNWLNLLVGSVIILIGILYANPIFDISKLQWVGLMTYKPFTEDYVPIFPWLGVVLIGIFLGKRIQKYSVQLHQFQHKNQSPFIQLTAWLGQRSLATYMIHQPILLGALSLWSWLFRH